MANSLLREVPNGEQLPGFRFHLKILPGLFALGLTWIGILVAASIARAHGGLGLKAVADTKK